MISAPKRTAMITRNNHQGSPKRSWEGNNALRRPIASTARGHGPARFP